MFAMITTDEYRQLINDQNALERVLQDLELAESKRAETEAELKDLLLMITKGTTSVNWGDKKFAWHDLAQSEEIVEYINNNYVVDGRLQFEKATKDMSFMEKLAKALSEAKENTDE